MSKKQKTAETLMIFVAALAALALLAVGVFAQSTSFRFFGPLSRIITPNGDGKNDSALFCFDNPADSDTTGKIYSLLGTEVATMGPRQTNVVSGCSALGTPVFPGTSNQSLSWDGLSNGGTVRSGVYIYRITAEMKVFSGTLIVVR
ncbi:MAG: hypothetical protein KGJ84_04860 [Elusimicrobia bacterium]|nr:hypothetical protein [Elusimicrobiota bacterium]